MKNLQKQKTKRTKMMNQKPKKNLKTKKNKMKNKRVIKRATPNKLF